MARTQVRRLPVVTEGGADYTSVFELSPAPVATPERWAREVFEGAPATYQAVLAAGWRIGLRLQLARRPAADRVLGWAVTESGPIRAALVADGPLLTARNQVDQLDGAVSWTTTVRYKGARGRLIWTLAAPVHHLTLPWLLRRAARRVSATRTRP